VRENAPWCALSPQNVWSEPLPESSPSHAHPWKESAHPGPKSGHSLDGRAHKRECRMSSYPPATHPNHPTGMPTAWTGAGVVRKLRAHPGLPEGGAEIAWKTVKGFTKRTS
jgi:hypothetical protein